MLYLIGSTKAIASFPPIAGKCNIKEALNLHTKPLTKLSGIEKAEELTSTL